MPLIDREQQKLFLRIVYDGAAHAGKTTTVRALAAILGRAVRSAEDANGRTLYFDWMEHQGGRFGDLTVCCQVVSVPGQAALAARRTALLADADVVVFVVGSRPDEVADGLASLESLRQQLAALGGERPPRPAVLLQANKRDLPEAVPLVAIREQLGFGDTVGVTESVAAHGTGILQPFVLAVRLALDRAEEMLRPGELPATNANLLTADHLLSRLRELDGEDQAELGGTEAGRGTSSGVPSAAIPAGWVWPPVEGRLILHEAASATISVEPTAAGDLRGEGGGWVAHAAAAARYDDEQEARADLREWAAWHAGLGRHLSAHRCIALGHDGTSYRLWQVLRRETSLEHQLGRLIRSADAESVAIGLLAGAEAVATIHAAVAPTGVRVGLDTVGLLDADRPAYVGLAPTPRGLRQRPTGFTPRELEVGTVLGPLLDRHAAALRNKGEAVRQQVLDRAQAHGREQLAAAIAELLAQPAGLTAAGAAVRRR